VSGILRRSGEPVTLAPASQADLASGTGDRDLALGTPLPERIRLMQDLTGAGPSRSARRLIFIWFRIYVWERSAAGKASRVNVRIPIPIPFIGGLLPRRITPARAVRLLADSENLGSATEVAPLLESAMAFELIRVEEDRPGKRELVVIGFD
jgi:hypothetical protein